MSPLYTSHLLNSNKCGIRIAHTNARSLVSFADEVSHLLLNEKIDILAITETWLDDSINDKEVCPSNYQIMRKDRNHGNLQI